MEPEIFQSQKEVLYLLKYIVQKKKERKRGKGREKWSFTYWNFVELKKKTFKRAENKIEHVSAILFLGENFGYHACHVIFLEGNRGFALPSRKSHLPGAMTTTPDHRSVPVLFLLCCASALNGWGNGNWLMVER